MKAPLFIALAIAGAASAFKATTTASIRVSRAAELLLTGNPSAITTDRRVLADVARALEAWPPGSLAFFDTAGASWCGAGCGKCYQLTSTGEAPCSTCGKGGAAGQSIIVMVTNLCPNNGNAQWCPTVGGTNQYGYSYHFDIMAQNEIFGDNVVVDFEPVVCPGQATSDWETCLCIDMQETDTTPVGLGDPGSGSPPSSSSRPPPATSSAPPSGGGSQVLYGQCGGVGWTGPTTCQPPATCKAQNQWYSQCLN
ncbi:uncharacterized protein Triagg1_5575 [Trichoderma aggressivum f. europaeum]|uniref:Cellulase n=1 Tax=Trichoderma aggressivum f. europaeum TaxID=173218 RepID=A0AAE1LYB7_9HYPO|nr:hypothetical protein Triagg1_5575 [Trichoderma aggressivum f. europaeum]